MFRQYKLREYNFVLLALLVAICTIGVLLVGSAEQTLQTKQLQGCIAGFVIMIIISFIDYSWVLNFYWIIYIFNLAMLVFVYVAGHNANGAARWLQIGSFQFQPTELSKILLVLFFSMYFMKHERDLNTFKTILKAVILLLLPLILILRQPDLKNTITIMLLFCIMIYVSGLSYKIIGRILLVVIPVMVVLLLLITKTDLKIIDDYQKERIMTFLEPDNDEYSDSKIQQNNSITAIGSGRLTGKGLNNNEVSSSNKGNFVAEIQTDFIFAVAGEELGFIGCLCIIIILFLIVFMCIMTGRRAKDKSGMLICTGIASLVSLQSFINICVATGILPNTGTPLPFVSYGLTSVISLFIGMGFVLNVGLQCKRYEEKLILKRYSPKFKRYW